MVAAPDASRPEAALSPRQAEGGGFPALLLLAVGGILPGQKPLRGGEGNGLEHAAADLSDSLVDGSALPVGLPAPLPGPLPAPLTPPGLTAAGAAGVAVAGDVPAGAVAAALTAALGGAAAGKLPPGAAGGEGGAAPGSRLGLAGADPKGLAEALRQVDGAEARELRDVAELLSRAPAEGAAQRAARSEAPVPSVPVHTPLGEGGWGREMGERLVWLASRGAQRAEIKLNPPELGPLEVQISLRKDEASVSFVSQHGAVRDAVESALPRLRELMGANGLSLVDVNVSSGHEGQERGGGEPGSGAAGASPGEGEGGAPGAEEAVTVTASGGRGLVDAFA